MLHPNLCTIICLPDRFCALDIRPPFLGSLLSMKDSGGTDDLDSCNKSGTEEKTSDHEVRPVKKMAPKFPRLRIHPRIQRFSNVKK
jgi:hypothetical protein